MQEVGNIEVKSARLKTVCYKEGFAWKIEEFEKWFSSMGLEEQVRSQIFQMEVDGTQHKFQLSVFKYLEYDSLVDDHTIMLSLSLLYHGPDNSIVIKPRFQIRTTGPRANGQTLKTKRVVQNIHSDAWIWSHHWLEVYKDDWNVLGDGSLTFCTLIQIQVLN